MTQFLPFVIVGLAAGSLYGLAGIGLVLTYKTSGIFNFAHGTIAALMAFAFYDLRQRNHIPWPVALVICVFVISPVIALILERMARKLTDAPVACRSARCSSGTNRSSAPSWPPSPRRGCTCSSPARGPAAPCGL